MGNLKSLDGVLVCKIILCDLWLQLSGRFCVPSAAVPRMFTVGHRQRNSYWTENKSTATSTRVSYLYWLVLIGFCLLNSFPLSFLSAFYLSPKISNKMKDDKEIVFMYFKLHFFLFQF